MYLEIVETPLLRSGFGCPARACHETLVDEKRDMTRLPSNNGLLIAIIYDDASFIRPILAAPLASQIMHSLSLASWCFLARFVLLLHNEGALFICLPVYSTAYSTTKTLGVLSIVA